MKKLIALFILFEMLDPVNLYFYNAGQNPHRWDARLIEHTIKPLYKGMYEFLKEELNDSTLIKHDTTQKHLNYEILY